MLNRNSFAAIAVIFAAAPMAACNLASNGLDYSHQELIKQDPAPVPLPSPPPVASLAPAASTGGAVIAIQNFAFAPASLSVAAGSTVTWTNMDSASHTVTFPDQSSGSLPSGGSFSKTFSAPGAYAYMCDFHPAMKATVVVN